MWASPASFLTIFKTMTPDQFQNKFIIEEIKKALGKKDSEPLSRYQMAKGAWRLRKTIVRETRHMIFMIIGILSAGFGLQGFLIPNDLIDGGVMGISLLTNNETDFPLSLLIIFINIPFLLIGWKQFSKIFALKSIVAIALLALVVAVFPYPRSH